MIKQVLTEVTEFKTKLRMLKESHYSRKIISHFDAYRIKYDFCRFFYVFSGGEELGIVSIFNNSLIAECYSGKRFDDEALEDIAFLIKTNKPQTAEIADEYSQKLLEYVKDDYTLGERHQFEFVCSNQLPQLDINEFPKLNDVFDILKTGFPDLAQCYETWLTDTSHRIRRGYAQAFILNNCTTATIQYIVNKKALIGQVATLPDYRGKMYARSLLYWIGEKLNIDGITVYLFARNHRKSYYEEIGFKEISVDHVLDRKSEE